MRKSGEIRQLFQWPSKEILFPYWMKTLLAVLPKDRSGWRQAFWLFQRHAQINGARPADLFRWDPEAVIKAARSDFEVSDEWW